jgi:hypothetical protein
MVNKKTHKHRKYRKRRIIKGGAYNNDELNTLQNIGFTNDQIETLNNMNIPINEITQRVNETEMNGNENNVADIIMGELLNQNFDIMDIEAIPHADDEINYLEGDDIDLNSSQGSLHLSDLDETSRMSGYTTGADESFGGKKNKSRKNKNKSRKNKNKSRKNKNKSRKNKNKSRKNKNKSRKQKGGMCYGNGVGANSYDPNYSIYNTRELQLFPYKTN